MLFPPNCPWNVNRCSINIHSGSISCIFLFNWNLDCCWPYRWGLGGPSWGAVGARVCSLRKSPHDVCLWWRQKDICTTCLICCLIWPCRRLVHALSMYLMRISNSFVNLLHVSASCSIYFIPHAICLYVLPHFLTGPEGYQQGCMNEHQLLSCCQTITPSASIISAWAPFLPH